MPQPFEKATAEKGDIPKPELNPMTNPVLGRHLGRWAEVYFTTPVEQREQAVLELLTELKQEEESGTTELPVTRSGNHRLDSEMNRSVVDIDRPEDRLAALEDAIRKFEVPRADSQRPPQLNSIPESSTETPPGVCPVCQHWNQPEQWYCGMCGYKLRAEPTSSHRVVPFRQATDTNNNAQSSELTPPSPADRHHTPNEAEPTNSFSFSMFGEPLETTDAERDVHSNRSSMWPLEAVEELPSSRVGSKVAAVCVILLVAAIGYSSRDRIRDVIKPWLQAQPSSTATQAQTSPVETAPAPASHATTPDPTQGPVAENASAEKNSGSPTDGKTAAEPREHAAVSADNKAATQGPTAPQALPASSTPPSAVSPHNAHESAPPDQMASLPVQGGNEELSRARELLSGSSKPADPGQASVWLWKAVGKNNAPAILLLADLYARGNGVPKSCDQARILLSAAAKKGSAEAGQKLRQIQNSECAGR